MDEEEEEKEMIDSRLRRKKGKTKQTPRKTSLRTKKKRKKRKLNVDHWSQRALKSANLNDRVGFVPSAEVRRDIYQSYSSICLGNDQEAKEEVKL